MPVSPVADRETVDATPLLNVLAAVSGGDFSARMPLHWTGQAGKVADGLNEVIIANQTMEAELNRVGRLVGKEGELSQRVVLDGAGRSWASSRESVNRMIDALVRPTSEMQRVIGAVADGDLSKKVTVDVHGDMLVLKNTINAMVDQLNGFASEVSRVAREVGTEGKLGQAAAVTIEVGGVWKDLTDNVNLMATNLTGQVRNIAEVTTAVANGDLSTKITIDVKGEFLLLKNTVNAMVDQLNAFASEVTRVAREVGVEGKLGGQAQSKEVGGVWKDLTDNVNQLAANLTNQVRAIAEVANAVTDGDLTRQVQVEARGEVAALKDTVNEMIRNLRETTRQNVEQDWLKTHLERFTRMLAGQRDLSAVSSMLLSELAPLVSAQHGVFYAMTTPTDGTEPVLAYQAGYGNEERKQLAPTIRLGEGLVGQCAREKKRILLTEVPGDYIRVSSALGAAPPLNVIVLPIIFEGSVRAVLELASLSSFSVAHKALLDRLPESIGLVLNTIEADTLTKTLLEQAQSQSEELRIKNLEAERKKREVEESKRLVEENSQLTVSSRYKSEFIANMSHELRTPLNSLLLLAEQLEDDPEGTMSETQVEYASVILASGRDLLALLNSILELAKVESGTVTVDQSDVALSGLRAGLLREYEPVALGKQLGFEIVLALDAPTTIATDRQRLSQILKNLLANAFKFTESGHVGLSIGIAEDGWNPETQSLAKADAVLAFAVTDTGRGVGVDQAERIFEAFVQGDGSTGRLYGGTGLGLSISRELAELLGGELTMRSVDGEGSTFTVFLPVAASKPELVAPPTVAPAPARVAVANGNGVAVQRLPSAMDAGPLAGVKVLVVDDDFRNCFALTALLERGKAHVTVAESGADALAALEREHDIVLVLMDIMMPVMDGYDTMRAIRSIDRLAALPIVAITGKVVPGERQRCLDAGADAYVPKPVDTDELIAAIATVCPEVAA
jgi:signal transduction histidine kinase/HAMP domain-containing protein/ActR/RegA family two-component response regulator